MYIISYWWAALFLIQAGCDSAHHPPVQLLTTAYNYDQILPLVATGLGIVGSIALGRYFTKRGRARGAAANAGRAYPSLINELNVPIRSAKITLRPALQVLLEGGQLSRALARRRSAVPRPVPALRSPWYMPTPEVQLWLCRVCIGLIQWGTQRRGDHR